MSRGREEPLTLWRDSVLRGESRGSEFGHNFARAASRWGMVQLLAGHPAPARVLFLGATLGGDIRGAVRLGHETSVADPSAPALDMLAGREPGFAVPGVSTIRMTPSRPLDLGAKFDIVWVTPWWLETSRREGVDPSELLAGAREYLAPGGRLLVQYLARRPSLLTRRMARLFSGQPFPWKLFAGLPHWSNRSLLARLRRLGLDSADLFGVAGGLTSLRTVVNASLPARRFPAVVFGSTSRLRGMPLRLAAALGAPSSLAFPFHVVSAGRSGSGAPVEQEGLAGLQNARVTGRVVTCALEENGRAWFVRVDTGCGSALHEARLLTFLSSHREVAALLHPPDRIGKRAGMAAAWYRYLPGFSLQGKGEGSHREEIESFLAELSAIAPPAFLESAHLRLGRYLARRRSRAPELVARASEALERLHREEAFRWITHGEMRDGNVHVVSDPPGLKVVDWVQSYRGHPLLDWWMYIYWNAAPREVGKVPERLRLGLSDRAVTDLWVLWRAAYDR